MRLRVRNWEGEGENGMLLVAWNSMKAWSSIIHCLILPLSNEYSDPQN